MIAGAIRYAEMPDTQKHLAEWHNQAGRDSTGCYKRACYVCGKVFYAGMPHAVLCSQRCNQTATLARRRALRREQRERRCPRCGRAFVARRKDGGYCSSACRQAAYRKRKTGSVPCESHTYATCDG